MEDNQQLDEQIEQQPNEDLDMKQQTDENEITDENDADEQIKNLREEIEKLDDRLKRSMAEFDNFRKRTIKEKSIMYDDGIRSTVEKLLPVLDNLERAVLASLNSNQNDEENNPSNSGLKQGVEMTLRQFKDILDSIGVKEIEAQNQKFNPKFHQAVAHIEDESYEAETVIEVLQKGYIYKDKVIRYSTVKVAN